MKGRKLAFKWSGPCALIEKRHQVYRVEAWDRIQWFTSDKLKPAPVGLRGEEPVEYEGNDEETEREVVE